MKFIFMPTFLIVSIFYGEYTVGFNEESIRNIAIAEKREIRGS